MRISCSDWFWTCAHPLVYRCFTATLWNFRLPKSRKEAQPKKKWYGLLQVHSIFWFICLMNKLHKKKKSSPRPQGAGSRKICLFWETVCMVLLLRMGSATLLPLRATHIEKLCPLLCCCGVCVCLTLLPLRVCCSQLCAMPVQHAKLSEQAQEKTSPIKNRCDKQVSSWKRISCHTDKNRYYTWS